MDVLSVPGLETSKKDDLGVVEQTPRSCHNHYYYPLSFLHMILLNAVVCGVEVAACAGFVYIPPMLLKAGYSEEEMNLLMGIGPLLAVVFVPLIGRFSDSCHSSFGRRRPFILLLSAVLIFSMYLISFGGHFSLLVLGDTSLSRLLGVWCLSVGSILMDFTSQACLTPCEAMLSDMSANSNQHDRIFTIYSVMVSLGGILGYMLTAIDWTSNCIGAYFGNQEASIFSMLIIIFAIALTATITMANEVPFVGHSRPRTISCNELSINTNSSGCIECGNFSGDNTILLADNRCLQNPQESGYESSGSDDEGVIGLLTKDRLNLLNLRIRFTYFCSLIQCRRLGRLTEGVCSSVVRLGKVITAHFRSLSSLPLALRRLAITNFCSWTAVMGFNLYFTDFVGQVVYGGNPKSAPGTVKSMAYDEGVRTGSLGLLLHCITSAFYSVLVERLTRNYGYKTAYMIGMTSFCLAMIGMVLMRNVVMVTIMAAMTGFSYATLTTIPFMLINQYHAADKQVVLTAVMGTVIHITGTVVSYMVTAGVFSLLACFFIQHIIVYNDEKRCRSVHVM